MSVSDEHFGDMERSVGVAPGFFQRLRGEDDWSFVIKLHAFFEAVAAHLLVFHFGEPALADIFARLELSNKVTGKTVRVNDCETAAAGIY